jgi:hypothetical protein
MGGNVEAYYDALQEKAEREERLGRDAMLLHAKSANGWVRWSATSSEYQQAMYEKAKTADNKKRQRRRRRAMRCVSVVALVLLAGCAQQETPGTVERPPADLRPHPYHTLYRDLDDSLGVACYSYGVVDTPFCVKVR